MKLFLVVDFIFAYFLLRSIAPEWAEGTAVLRLFLGVVDAVWLSSRPEL